MEVGSTFTVTWKILIAHNQINWDIHYSTSSSAGPWTVVALNQPPGSAAVGSIHTYDWTVPDDVDDSVWIRVIMDNSGTDYNDVNNKPFAIVAVACDGDTNGDGVVNVTDLLNVINQWGFTDVDSDLNGDGIVDVTDLLLVVGNWGDCD